ncbi:unnamed protein product, partial [Phaeothamnion confervicola]
GVSEAVRDESLVPVSLTRPALDAEFISCYRSHRVEMARIAHLITGSPTAAEEIVQEAFVRVYERWDDLRTPVAYLRTCVVNRSRSWLRRRRLVKRHEDSVERPEAHIDHPNELADALECLTPRAVTVVVLRYYSRLSTAEVAATLKVSEGTVKSTLARALTKLKEELG